MEKQMDKSVVRCRSCGTLIVHGQRIVVKPTESAVYCSAECFVEDNSGYILDEYEGEDYESWFEEE